MPILDTTYTTTFWGTVFFKKKFAEFWCANFSQFHAFYAPKFSVHFAKKSVPREFQYITNFTQKGNLENNFSLQLPKSLPLKL